MMDELQEYWDILLGRLEPPIDEGIGTLAHLSSAHFARGKEMEALLLRAEREGRVAKNSNHYKFRTGELRSFLEMSKNSYELGSRLVTLQSMEGGDPSL